MIGISIGIILLFSYKSFTDTNKNNQREQEGLIINGHMEKEGLITNNKKRYIKSNNEFTQYNIYENGELRPIAEMLAYGCKDSFCKAKRDLDYVKKIKYEIGQKKIKRPEEIMLSGSGDCDERSFLMGSLLYEQEINTILILTKDHAFLGIKCNNEENQKNKSHIQIENDKYYIAETTDINAEIGKSNNIKPYEIKTIFDINKKILIPLEKAIIKT